MDLLRGYVWGYTVLVEYIESNQKNLSMVRSIGSKGLFISKSKANILLIKSVNLKKGDKQASKVKGYFLSFGKARWLRKMRINTMLLFADSYITSGPR